MLFCFRRSQCIYVWNSEIIRTFLALFLCHQKFLVDKSKLNFHLKQELQEVPRGIFYEIIYQKLVKRFYSSAKGMDTGFLNSTTKIILFLWYVFFPQKSNNSSFLFWRKISSITKTQIIIKENLPKVMIIDQ